MAEEHRCQAPPEGPRLCANNCGFFGSPATLGLCSKCYHDYRLKEQQQASAKMAVEKSLLATASAPPSEAEAEAEAAVEQAPSASAPTAVPLPRAKQEPCSTATAAAAAQQPGRCMSCRKRVGLTGFRCRCGATFCGTHRYPEQHGCTFDFKTAGREALARANPVVKAEKLDKI